jgi:hypothetical protein
MLNGKAMVVCMSRRNCVKLYDALTALPGCPEVKIVMTGNLSEDPPKWSQAGHITTKPQRDTIKARMKDIDDPLKIVIVRDMWLTGTDIPCLHTLYVDKPMKDDLRPVTQRRTESQGGARVVGPQHRKQGRGGHLCRCRNSEGGHFDSGREIPRRV